ncbi:MAG: UDP-N-acetylmuramoyl-L-alanyl-D-glutamate--2,6-diaminopimelate ligase [Thermodesulfovibrionales bacterium]|nr:UDP-N-acetylmuramoyl-L-alanyl-D-glutamate--2,6-diaminopimelate ligase [Thermodesulfovibrionales bacterium]
MKTIKDLIDERFKVVGDINKTVCGISIDSRDIRDGDMFVALKGINTDGHLYIDDAIQRGAKTIVYDIRNEMIDKIDQHPDITWLGHEDTSDALAYISNEFYESPSEDVKVIGITGTNGKTTTSFLIKSILDACGYKTGLIGTIQYVIGDKMYESTHTTPYPHVYQRMLRQMSDEGCEYVVSEISSHALLQKRADYTKVGVAVFTNLTRDHLDYHGDMENYFHAKSRLFTDLLIDGGVAVINIDDSYGCRLVEILKARNIKTITFGLNNTMSDITADGIEMTFKGIKYRFKYHGEIKDTIVSPLCGITGVYNTLASIGVSIAIGIPIKKVKEGINMTNLVKGRFEKVDLGQDFLAVVDYAHTEDALERLLLTARHLLHAYRLAKRTELMMKDKDRQFTNEEPKTGKVITVFGCGGNRDKGKRSKMGEIASRLSDFVIVTSDNPRYEDPKEIIREIEKGIKGDNYIVIPDRKVAIKMAVELASCGDIVLVAGKGHEEYQEIEGKKKAFSDKKALEEAIKMTINRPSFKHWLNSWQSDKVQDAKC